MCAPTRSVPAYGRATRSLQDEYRVDLNRITWVVDDEEHVPGMRLPAHVERVGAGRSLSVSLMHHRSRCRLQWQRRSWPSRRADARLADTGYRPALARKRIADRCATAEAHWYHRTGIYPIHGLVVVRDAALARFPWLARELFDAFDAWRRRYLQALAAGASDWESDGHYRAMAGLVGDPLPYGIEANRPALEALLRYCHEQGLLDRRPSVAEMFIDPMT